MGLKVSIFGCFLTNSNIIQSLIAHHPPCPGRHALSYRDVMNLSRYALDASVYKGFDPPGYRADYQESVHIWLVQHPIWPNRSTDPRNLSTFASPNHQENTLEAKQYVAFSLFHDLDVC